MKKLPILALLLVFTGFVTDCKDIDDYYARLDKNGLTPEITNFVPNYIIEEMQSLGFPINGGAHPPVVEGSYLVSPFILLNSNIPEDSPGYQFANYTFSFYNMNSMTLTVDMEYVNANGNNTGQGSQGYIVGTGNKFSAFFDVFSNSSNGSSAEMVVAVSGTLVDGGIEDWYFTNFMIDDYGDANGNLIANGQGRVSYDSDGFSELVGGKPLVLPVIDKVSAETFFDFGMEL